MQAESIAFGIALSVLGALARELPEFAHWLEEITSGRVDPLSVRVRDVLPEESRSRAVQRELGG